MVRKVLLCFLLISIFGCPVVAQERTEQSGRQGMRVCLMQDPLYRNDICHHTMGYTDRHYAMTSYYLGTK